MESEAEVVPFSILESIPAEMPAAWPDPRWSNRASSEAHFLADRLFEQLALGVAMAMRVLKGHAVAASAPVSVCCHDP